MSRELAKKLLEQDREQVRERVMKQQLQCPVCSQYFDLEQMYYLEV